MAFTNLNSSQITPTTVLRGGPKENYLQVNSDNFNKLQTDVSSLQTSCVKEHAPVAVNSTATLTPAQVATGYITSTSGAAVTMTMPTGTLLGTYLGASQGTTLDLYIDNTGGSNTITMAVGVNGIQSAFGGTLTLVSGVTGQARFTIMFSSATAYTFSRTA